MDITLAQARTAASPSAHRTDAGREPAPDGVMRRAWQFAAGEPIGGGRAALRLLGGGERYEAYVAWDDDLLAPIVAKLVRPHLVGDPATMVAIQRESDAIRDMQHPAIVRAFAPGLSGERPHLALEFLDGPRLSTLIRRHGPLSAEQAVLLARQLASALHHVARRGWVHLDVKPRNIIMASPPRLIDLSVARRIADLPRVTGSIGTDVYMAPEQCDPARAGELGWPADVWGLGVTLFEALAGRKAFPRRTGQTHPQLTTDAPAMPSKAPPVLASLIRACLDRQPGNRPTPEQVYDDLEPLVGWSSKGVRRLR